MALLTAGHCIGTAGASVRGPNGSIIGTWMADHGSKSYDLGVIRLYSGNWPAVRNQVYRGNTTPSAFTITANPTADLGCQGSWDDWTLADWQRDVYQAFQQSSSTTTLYRTGHLYFFYFEFDHNFQPYPKCSVWSNLPYHACCKDSGSPWFIAGRTNTVFGISHYQYQGELIIKPLYEGLQVLNSYWVANGNHVGAWLCQTSTCGGIGGA